MRFEGQRRSAATTPVRGVSTVGGDAGVPMVGRPTATVGRFLTGAADAALPAGAIVHGALTRISALSGGAVPDDLGEWARRCGAEDGFPLLGTGILAEPYVALQWNGERAARAGLAHADLVVLTGLVTAWQHDRSVGDLQEAVTRALAGDVLNATAVEAQGAPVTAGVVTTAVCAGLLSGVAEEELPALVDVAGTLMQVRPATVESVPGRSAAAGHAAAAGWLASQVHLAGLTAYDGAFTDTVATATLPADGPSLATPVRQLVEDLQ